MQIRAYPDYLMQFHSRSLFCLRFFDDGNNQSLSFHTKYSVRANGKTIVIFLHRKKGSIVLSVVSGLLADSFCHIYPRCLHHANCLNVYF
jgi:hypothetical protein